MVRSSDIVGHESRIALLRKDLAMGNVSHAYLFSGPKGIGKLTVAKWFAGELLTQGIPDAQKEEALRRIDRLLHPDLLVLDRLWIEDAQEDWDLIARYSNVPQEHRSKGESVMRTDTIGIEDVRVLQERLYASASGRWKVCIIRSMERMQDAAANALLKILEEPPPGRVFLLTTASVESLLPTVVSRVRRIEYARVPEATMRPLVNDLPDDEAGFLLHLAQGAPGVLRTMLGDPDLLRAEKSAHAAALAAWNAPTLAARMAALEPLWKRGEEADRFLFHLALTLRECDDEKRAERGRFLLDLSAGLDTNAHRPLLTQRFALAVNDGSLLPAARLG